MSSSVLENLRSNKAALKSEMHSMLERAEREKRDLTSAEDKVFNAKLEQLERIAARIDDISEQMVMEARAAAHHVETGTAKRERSGWSVTGEPEVYRDPHKDPTSPSFFLDMRNAKLGDWAAADRLNRNEQARGLESRAGDMTTVAGAGGQFAPPAWLVDQFVALARPGRVAANLATHDALPSGVSSLNLPKVASGAAVGVQATQNSALVDTAMTTTSVSSGVTTIGGRQIVSLQLLQQSGIPFDRVILGDLAADYAKQLDTQFLYGSGASGQLRGLVGVATNTAYTTASPALTSATAANSFYNKVIAASAGIATTRYLAANAVVMHPNRWAWCLEALDGQVRPIIAADGNSMNSAAVSTEVAAEGSVGTIAKLPVYLDANISLTANSATNQDEVYVLRREDVYLWESELRLESFEQPYADNASVLFRALAFAAAIPDRYSASVASIRGTGLVAPVL
ncbi:phage major capsid protein [Nocardioides pocheonensis]|uniref:Phage major capsid protein n=1 Tax=Nocardioides pocheonensis TaxID=661485 RepID=A0A3N0GMH7_9ACTN|nr:phage major capsid protein [Nocardioides pocheonensis]RNM13290.1 phage major capsid protein [Nocardioides pocheonensis]